MRLIKTTGWPSNFHRSNLFDDFDHFFESAFTPTTTTATRYQPACDVDESDEHFLLSFDLPGMKKEDIKIDVQDGHLSLSGERVREFESKDGFRKERSYGKFQRVFTLPDNVRIDNIEAHYEDGVLSLLLPKQEKVRPQQIEVKSGKEGLFKRLLGHKKEEDTKTDVKVS